MFVVRLLIKGVARSARPAQLPDRRLTRNGAEKDPLRFQNSVYFLERLIWVEEVFQCFGADSHIEGLIPQGDSSFSITVDKSCIYSVLLSLLEISWVEVNSYCSRR